MELKGKRILFLGDSITQGHGVANEDNSYWKVLARRTGAICEGFGIGGTTIAPQRYPSSNPVWDQDFVPRVKDMSPTADVVMVLGGTNDWGHGDAPFGTMDSRDPVTFYGSLHALCRALIEKYPEAVIVFMTPLHRVSEESNTQLNECGHRQAASLEQYSDAIKEVAGYYALPVLDLRHVCGIQPLVEIQKQLFMPDGLHPNDAGHARMADRIEGFLKAL